MIYFRTILPKFCSLYYTIISLASNSPESTNIRSSLYITLPTFYPFELIQCKKSILADSIFIKYKLAISSSN
ncbi:hypothetical protein RIR_jg37655.t1 [Rhizophagus irregularis DAOM 181602=DAOM 197198]|nr:hypothetical protein RIR_jg37655.t1 [Rhizophagus irregularis DAOM 181602=DAOM 197198]